jgi:hypothetical protein
MLELGDSLASALNIFSTALRFGVDLTEASVVPKRASPEVHRTKDGSVVAVLFW